MTELRYKAKRPELIDALAEAGISTASELAGVSGLAAGTAQRIMRGKPVTLRVAIEVVHALQRAGAEIAVSTGFEAVNA